MNPQMRDSAKANAQGRQIRRRPRRRPQSADATITQTWPPRLSTVL